MEIPQTVIRNLADIAHKGGNYLLNVGPTARVSSPRLQCAFYRRWEVDGQNGESIYGTTASPIGNCLSMGGARRSRENCLYIYSIGRITEACHLGIASGIEEIYLLADPDRDPLKFRQESGDVLIRLAAVQFPGTAFSEHNTVLVIEYSDTLETAVKPILVDPSSTTYLLPDSQNCQVAAWNSIPQCMARSERKRVSS